MSTVPGSGPTPPEYIDDDINLAPSYPADVVYDLGGFIPTSLEHIDRFFEIAPLSPTDVVYDLGAGDGRLVFAALDKGAAQAFGVELNPERVRAAREFANKQGLEDKAVFLEADVMAVNLASASVVLCYLSVAASKVLKAKLEAELKPGTRVVTETYPVPGWQPNHTAYIGHTRFFLYIMPPQHAE